MRRMGYGAVNCLTVTFHGEFHNVDGIELDVVHGRREPRNVPVLIGATGDKMLELTGEMADGCLLNYCVPPSYNDRAMELLAAGAKKAGRTIDAIDRPQQRAALLKGSGRSGSATTAASGGKSRQPTRRARARNVERRDVAETAQAGDDRDAVDGRVERERARLGNGRRG